MRLELDGRMLTEKGSAHRYLAERMDFPDYYGKNLDALYDCLTDICEKTEVTVYCYGIKNECMDGILAVFEEAAEENENLWVQVAE